MIERIIMHDGAGAIDFRALWILLSLGYFAAASYLALSSHQYRRWIWGGYYFIGAAILVFFNIDYYSLTPFLIQSAEFLLWAAAFAGGTLFFVVLISISDLLDAGLVELPTFRELPGFLWKWAVGDGDAVVRPALVACDRCGRFVRGNVYESGKINPVGVGECPDCGGEEWSELSHSEE